MNFKRLRKAWHYFSFGNAPFLILKPFVEEAYDRCGLSVPYFATLILYLMICIGCVYICIILEGD